MLSGMVTEAIDFSVLPSVILEGPVKGLMQIRKVLLQVRRSARSNLLCDLPRERHRHGCHLAELGHFPLSVTQPRGGPTDQVVAYW